MSEDLTIAMYNRGRYEGAVQSAQSWRRHAEEIEAKLVRAAAELDVTIKLSNAIIAELKEESVKPRRLSDPENRQLRVRFKDELRPAAQAKFKAAGAQGIDI